MAEQTPKKIKEFNTATDRMTKTLAAANKSLLKVTEEVTKQVALSESISEEIQDKQAKLAELGNELTFKIREHEADLALRVREDKMAVLDQILADEGLVALTDEEYKDLKSEVESLNKSFEEELDKRVAEVKHSLEQENLLESTKEEAKHSVNAAETKASLESIKEQRDFLASQLEVYKEMVNEERKALVEVASSSAKIVESKMSSENQKAG